MRILVTGAAGFVGSALAPALALEGNEVFAVVLPSEPAPGGERIHRVEMDLSTPTETVLPRDGVDCVIHLAQSARFREFPQGAGDVFAVNLGSTGFLVDWAVRAGAKNFIFASTGSLYLPGYSPFGEESPTGFHDIYTWTKFAAEGLLWLYRDLITVQVTRLFAPFGPGQKGRMIPGLIQRIRQGSAVTLPGGHGMLINPVYIDDLTRVFMALTRYPDPVILNVGGSEALSIRDMARTIGRVLDLEPKFETLPPMENADLVGDISRMKQTLGMEPGIGFETGVRNMLKILGTDC